MGALQFFRRSNGLIGRKIITIIYPVDCIQSRAFSDSKIVDSNDTVLPVLIVGVGPVGLVLSILLTKLDRSWVQFLDLEKVVNPVSVAHFSQYKLVWDAT
ncbi:hypothetical protein Q3G72_015849 [Acer saccharum]|nr:hypothetical protein Q3G72_015849 [Acer saccharum]